MNKPGEGSAPLLLCQTVRVWRVGDVTVDTQREKVFRGGDSVVMTKKEYALLKAFLLHSGRVVTREELFRQVWGYDYVGNTRTVDVHVKQLRRKLGLHGVIQTVYRIGYRLDGAEAVTYDGAVI